MTKDNLDKFFEDWRTQCKPDAMVSQSNQERLNSYIEAIRKKERKQLMEAILDFVVGFLLLSFGVSLAIDAFTFVPGLSEVIELSDKKYDIGQPPGIDLFIFYHTSWIAFIFLGLYLPIASFKTRFGFWKKQALEASSANQWFEEYYTRKIKLCKIGKRLGISLFLLSSFWNILFLITDRKTMTFSMNYDVFVSFLIMFVFPLSIYWVASWQEKRIQLKKTLIET
ncbi:hypothetical protein [Aliikangiella sp. G2MR2-5]|uniref:hypothetical protein n=1 Tax=Aliikangiella sp. G2MR2-5 TaxID=2788943 RepID=UPI0018AB04DD|nr:hypothetical protein [Aliikangiella sp. G2MR2-5]